MESKKRLQQVLTHADQLCRERGVRMTEQRKTALKLLLESDKPLSAYELLDRMRSSVKNPAPPTVYRALDFLLDQGLIHKLESIHAYVGCSRPDHPHAGQFFICSDCGDVAEVADERIAKRLYAAGEVIGFQTKRPVIELMGTCFQCSDK